MDYSQFSIKFLVINDIDELIISKLKNETKLFKAYTKTNILEIAIENNSQKSFDILLNHGLNLGLIHQNHLLNYYLISAVKNFSKFNNRYYIEKILNIILANNSEEIYPLIFCHISKIRYDLEKTKENMKKNTELRIELLKYIIYHPEFKLESFIDFSQEISEFIDLKTMEIIKEKCLEKGIDNTKLKKFICHYLIRNSALIKLFTLDEYETEIDYKNVKMKLKDVQIIINNIFPPKLKITSEYEQQLIENFKKILANGYNNYRNLALYSRPILGCLFFQEQWLNWVTNTADLPKVIMQLCKLPNKLILNFFINHIEQNYMKLNSDSLRNNAYHQLQRLKKLL